MKRPLCNVCFKGRDEGVELIHIGDIAPRRPIFHCRAHLHTPYSAPIDVEAWITLDKTAEPVIVTDVAPAPAPAAPLTPATPTSAT